MDKSNLDFEQLWQQAEVESIGRSMAQEYPRWLQRQKRRRNAAIAMIFVGSIAGVSIPLLHTNQPSIHEEYIDICCNRTDISDTQWVTLAAEMLTTDMI